MHIMTDRGWQMLGGPLQPTPPDGHWWQFGMLGHAPQFVASEREALDMLADVKGPHGTDEFADRAAEILIERRRKTNTIHVGHGRLPGSPHGTTYSARTNQVLRRAQGDY